MADKTASVLTPAKHIMASSIRTLLQTDFDVYTDDDLNDIITHCTSGLHITD